jgi:hypothetical protein
VVDFVGRHPSSIWDNRSSVYSIRPSERLVLVAGYRKFVDEAVVEAGYTVFDDACAVPADMDIRHAQK